jgi:hypothetical protein
MIFGGDKRRTQPDRLGMHLNAASEPCIILKRAIGVCCGPFMLSNVEAWAAHNTVTRLENEKSRSPFDKALLSIDEGLRTNGIFHSPTALF